MLCKLERRTDTDLHMQRVAQRLSYDFLPLFNQDRFAWSKELFYRKTLHQLSLFITIVGFIIKELKALEY